MTRAKVYASVWDALADTSEQAANLRARTELMQQIATIVKKNAGPKLRLRNGAESPSPSASVDDCYVMLGRSCGYFS